MGVQMPISAQEAAVEIAQETVTKMLGKTITNPDNGLANFIILIYYK